jgi:hypothetical protein
MGAVQVITRALESGVLSPNLLYVPAGGASPEMIREEEGALRRPLSRQHKEVLTRWNGINLDVLTLYGCGVTPRQIGRLSAYQRLDPWLVEGIAFGSDPAGFIYVEEDAGNILCLDHDGGEIERVAANLNDFFGRYVFGEDAHLFGGDEWKEQLRAAGLL